MGMGLNPWGFSLLALGVFAVCIFADVLFIRPRLSRKMRVIIGKHSYKFAVVGALIGAVAAYSVDPNAPLLYLLGGLAGAGLGNLGFVVRALSELEYQEALSGFPDELDPAPPSNVPPAAPDAGMGFDPKRFKG